MNESTQLFNAKMSCEKFSDEDAPFYTDRNSGKLKKELAQHRNCLLCSSSLQDLYLEKEGFSFVKCRDCNLVFVNPILNEEDTISLYEDGKTINNEIDVLFKEMNERVKSFDIAFKEIEKYINIGRMCDIGCGAGAALQAAKKRGWIVEGVEPCKKARKLISENFGITVKNELLHEDTFADGELDLVTVFQVIEHLVNPTKFLSRVYKILKPGGVLYLDCPNIDSLSCKLFRKNHVHFSGRVHLNYFTPQTITKMLESTGYKIIYSKTRVLDITISDLFRAILNLHPVHREGSNKVPRVFHKAFNMFDYILKPQLEKLIIKGKIKGSYLTVMTKK